MSLKQLTDFKDIDSLKEYFADECFCIEWYIKMRWPNGVICVKCGTDNVCTFSDGIRFKCRQKGCRKIFSYKVGTALQNTKLTVKKWIIAYYQFLRDTLGVSSYTLAGDCNVTQTTGLNVLYRIRCTYTNENKKTIFGMTEDSVIISDEKYVKAKGRFQKKNKKPVHGKGRAKNPGTTTVIGIGDKATKRIKLFKTPNTNGETIMRIVLRNVLPGCRFHTDEWGGYKDLIKYFKHLTVVHGLNQFSNGDVNTNLMEGAWALLGRLIFGRYRGVSEKFIWLYITEQEYRYNMRELSIQGKFEHSMELTTNGYTPLHMIKQGMAA